MPEHVPHSAHMLDTDGMPTATGRHGLGPHVVGQRVVVRRLLRGETGPTGGPAFTDLLGTCLAWDADGCLVQPADGDPVRIALTDIVSGKPVPPRPATRLRVEPREAQLRALALWPDLVTEPLGDWVLRRSPTATARRASSVLAIGSPGPAPHDALDRVVAFYAAAGKRPIAAVLPGSAEEALFADRGWVLESADADTVFQLAGVAAARRRLRGVDLPDLDVALTSGAGIATLEVRLGDGSPVARGRAACADGWVGFRGIEVEPAHRGRRIGLLVMAALLEWGAEQGATTAYLQLLADNHAARALYDGLGFVDHHTYRYLAAP
ncbi:GNAT family N-acetyltransferase [Nocardioides sp. SYSU D00038]|uniref:GNAT family N-acetyltransferase n=1 Tax=Nocardioides sp. SYSU D00038 TaxID=2812554 RepID=UPI0019670F2B|nr:GNAT family N-acetyltransferase [Nocardioides sp. SYSU D00038]